MTDCYDEGCKAAWEWYGTPEPKNPHSEGSQEAAEWQRGFDQGCDDYWEAWKVGEA